MSHRARYAGGVLAQFHKELMGIPVDFSALDPKAFDPTLLEEAQATWLERFQTEFRSVQIMIRFLTESVGAGDPIDIYAGGADLIADEIRHAALCAGVTEALGTQAIFPSPIHLQEPEAYLQAPMGERALHTAISMLGINETISSGYIEDLQQRCQQPVIREVLNRTIEDEEGHHGFGWSYIEQSLKRFPASTMNAWRHLVKVTLDFHINGAQPILDSIPEDKRTLDAWPDEERVALGLFSRERQALVFQKTYDEHLAPKLKELDLFPF